MISIDLRSHGGLMCPSCNASVAALVDGVTPGHAECVGCVADELWPEMFATLRLLRDEIDAVLRASNPCMGCRAAGLPKCDFACERATAYDAIRREGREQVYAELTKLARSQTCAPPCCDGIYTEALATIRAELERDFVLDLEARATGPEVAKLQRALKTFAPKPTREALRQLCEREGYGAIMQLTEQLWAERTKADGHPGSEHTRGPCAVFMVPCSCVVDAEDGIPCAPCDWCCGSGRVTKRVAEAQTARTSETGSYVVPPRSSLQPGGGSEEPGNSQAGEQVLRGRADWVREGFRLGETREFVIPGVEANPHPMQITGVTDTVLTVETNTVFGRPFCPHCGGPCKRGLCPVWSE